MNMVISQETFKIMFYNVLNFPDQGPVNRIDNLAYILQDYQPDIFMICELNNEQGANDILGVLQTLKPSYSKANFVLNTSDDADGDQNFLQNIIFYDSSKFILNAQFEVTTIFRDFNHYILKLNTVDQVANPIILNAIVCHLKSSSGTVNQALRLQMVNDLTTYLDGLSSDELVLLGGDLNLYTQSEAAFQELIDPSNNITFTDPANRIGSWSNNLVYLDVFTQSTRTQSGLGGATGGFDDRFDFILTSENLAADPDLFYVPNSYQVFGNNGNNNCYNQEINSFNCSGPEFDFTIRDALYYMSDHLPVTLELQTNESLLNITEFVTTPSYRFINGNLVEETVELAIESNVNQLKNVTVYNVYGQRMAQLEMDALNHLKFDVSNWSSGIYYITFPNRQIKPLKFIKK
ncbi:MAG: T9SS type A sorting domain-containing protein [Flavobacteriaceae bacterium]|nr:T9SS type A sorting domain-containing protein [Bacteroidia bacterium]NNF74715.1 T9SS type A sorting domain-containing protein [Flavobacteriaceae bacterium]